MPPKPHPIILAKIMSSCLTGEELTCDSRPKSLSSNSSLFVKSWDIWEFDGGQLPVPASGF